MVYFSRRATVKPGKFQDAIKWGKEVADYLNSKYGTKIGLYSQRLGDNPAGTVYWVANMETMTKYLELVENLNKDEGYLERLTNSIGMFVDGQTFDSVMDKH
jgi:hypothetical protein